MENNQTIHCDKFHCDLTPQGCIDRRTAFNESRGKLVAKYQECQECSKVFKVQPEGGIKVTERKITAENITKKITTGGKKIMRDKIGKDQLIELVNQKKGDKEIGKILGCCTNTVFNHRKKYGIESQYEKARPGKKKAIRKGHAASAPARKIRPADNPSASAKKNSSVSERRIKAAELLSEENELLAAQITENETIIAALIAA